MTAEDSPPAGRPAMYGPFYRIASRTQTPEDARNQARTNEIWGRAPRYNPLWPQVQAYRGSLPEGVEGIEFYTNAEPDRGGQPHEAHWSGNRPDIMIRGDFAVIDCVLTANTQVGDEDFD